MTLEYNNFYKGRVRGFVMTEEVLNDETKRILGRDAQRNNILAARVVAETVKLTGLGILLLRMMG